MLRQGVWLTILGLWSFAQGPPAASDEFLRRAIARYSNGDFQSALEFCERAEEFTQDPGLVAFDKAAALYQMGRDRQAELHYRRCLEDAQGVRLARASYNLGNCLVRQSHADNRRLLLEAIACYERCLQQPEVDASLASDVRYNLELAKLLLQSAKAGKPQDDSKSSADTSDGRFPNANEQNAMESADGGDRAEMDRGEKAGRDSPLFGGAEDKRRSRRMTQPGRGNLPPIPDEPVGSTLSPEDARDHLQKAADRIVGERRRHRARGGQPMPAHVKDW